MATYRASASPVVVANPRAFLIEEKRKDPRAYLTYICWVCGSYAQPRHMFRNVLPAARIGLRLKGTFRAEKPETIRSLESPLGLKSVSDAEQKPRSFAQKRQDFMDLQKNRARREELKQEFAQSSFASIYGFRDTGGKFFVGPAKPFQAANALFMPNVKGATLDGVETTLANFWKAKPVIVRLFSSDIGKRQTDAFLESSKFKPLLEHIDLVDVNTPTSFVNRMLVKLFANRIRKTLTGQFHRYLIASAIPPAVRRSIWAANELGGYLYVVDMQGKIRWASAGPPVDGEIEALTAAVKAIL